MTPPILILGIETSCDDTGAAVVVANADLSVTVLSNIITPQDHTATGGVVPEIAARHHATAIIPTIDEALATANVTLDDISAIAVTKGPGLIPCLLVGVETSKTIAWTRDIPIIGVNHMEGHIASTFAEHPAIKFPAIALLVSGGHTMLVGIAERSQYHLIGTTRDDAAGEAFDKVAKMLGLPYPGGPALAELAKKGNPRAIHFPRPMIQSGDFSFSFSGLKTAVLYYVRDHPPATDADRADIAASFQEAVIEVLIVKSMAALALHHGRTLILGGGVSANEHLRTRLQHAIRQEYPNVALVVPRPDLFTDNGAMIAIAAAPRVRDKKFDEWRSIEADPNLKLTE